MSSYVLRKIDSELWRRVRARAALDRVNLKQLILWLLEQYAAHGLTWTETQLGATCPRADARTGPPVKLGETRLPRTAVADDVEP